MPDVDRQRRRDLPGPLQRFPHRRTWRIQTMTCGTRGDEQPDGAAVQASDNDITRARSGRHHDVTTSQCRKFRGVRELGKSRTGLDVRLNSRSRSRAGPQRGTRRGSFPAPHSSGATQPRFTTRCQTNNRLSEETIVVRPGSLLAECLRLSGDASHGSDPAPLHACEMKTARTWLSLLGIGVAFPTLHTLHDTPAMKSRALSRFDEPLTLLAIGLLLMAIARHLSFIFELHRRHAAWRREGTGPNERSPSLSISLISAILQMAIGITAIWSIAYAISRLG